jgi:AsmA protein
MKALKYGVIGVLGVVLLLIMAAGIFLASFNPNNYKDDLQQWAREATGRELQLQGDIHLSLLPNIALQFGPATLGNANGFGAQPMLSIEKVRLGIKLRPLLARRVEVATAELTRPELLLQVNATGGDNWSDIGKTKTVPPPTASTSSTSMTVAVSGLRLLQGSLKYSDARDGTRLSLSDLTIGTGTLQLAAPIDVNGSFVLKSGDTLQAAASISGRATIDPDHDRYLMESPLLDVTVSGKGLPKSGIKAALRFRELRADLKAQTLQAPGMEIKTLGTTLRGDITGQAITDAPRFTGRVSMPQTSLRELMPMLDLAAPATSDPTTLQRLSFSGDLDATTKGLRFTKLKMVVDDSALSGSAGISDFETLAMNFDLAINRLNLDRYLANAAPGGASAGSAGDAASVDAEAQAPTKGAPAAPSAPVELPAELIRGLNLRGSVAIESATVAAINLSKIKLGLNARGGKLRVFPSEAQLYGGQYRGDISIDASGKTPTVSFNEAVTGVDFAPLLADWFETRKISGRGNFTIKASARGKDSDALLRTLAGALTIKVDNGALEGSDLWYEIRRANAVLRRRSAPDKPAPERTVFSALSASGTLTNGVLQTADVYALTRALKVTGGGTVDLVRSQLDLKLDAAVQKVPNDPNAADSADVVGFTVPLNVTGALSDPSVRPDLSLLAKAAVKQKIDEKKQELEGRKQEIEQQLRDKLKDKLKGLFGN